MLTIESVQKALPPQIKVKVSQQLVDNINNASSDPIAAQNIRENFVSYTSVLLEGKYKTQDYLHAVAYVSFKVLGHTNQASYVRTFPTRYQKLVARGATDKDISSYVAAYNKNKLVNLILEQTLTPAWILNSGNFQKAINVQVDLMTNATSEKVRSDAANSLLTHLKQPEKKEIELNIGIADNSGLNELRDNMTKLAQIQQDLISGGMATKEVAHMPLIEHEE